MLADLIGAGSCHRCLLLVRIREWYSAAREMAKMQWPAKVSSAPSSNRTALFLRHARARGRDLAPIRRPCRDYRPMFVARHAQNRLYRRKESTQERLRSNDSRAGPIAK